MAQATRRGRPRLYEQTHHVHLTMDRAAHQSLVGPMLEEFRDSHPEATANDYFRFLLDDTVRRWRAAEAERNGAAARLRARMRRLAESAAAAGDDKIDGHVRRLA